MLKKILQNFKRDKTAVDTSNLMMTYNRLPIAFERGEGSRLWDQNGRDILMR